MKVKTGQIWYDPDDGERVRITKVTKTEICTVTIVSATGATSAAHYIGYKESWSSQSYFNDRERFLAIYRLDEVSQVKAIMDIYEDTDNR